MTLAPSRESTESKASYIEVSIPRRNVMYRANLSSAVAVVTSILPRRLVLTVTYDDSDASRHLAYT